MKTESDKKKSGISAIILCGGKSTRMGKDKAGLLIGKKTFLQQIEEHVSGADEVLLSVKDRPGLSGDRGKTYRRSGTGQRTVDGSVLGAERMQP